MLCQFIINFKIDSYIEINGIVGERMGKRNIVLLNEPVIDLSKEVKKELETLMILSIYQSLYKAEMITFEQLRYLENLNRKYW